MRGSSAGCFPSGTAQSTWPHWKIQTHDLTSTGLVNILKTSELVRCAHEKKSLLKWTSPFALKAHFATRYFYVFCNALSHDEYGRFPLSCIKIAFWTPMIRQHRQLWAKNRQMLTCNKCSCSVMIIVAGIAPTVVDCTFKVKINCVHAFPCVNFNAV